MEHYMTSEKIEAYLKELSNEERAEATIEKYRRALLSFAAFLCGAAVTPETIKNWKDDLREKLRAVDDQHLSGRAERFLSLLWLDRLPRAVLKNSAPPVSRQQTGVNAHRIWTTGRRGGSCGRPRSCAPDGNHLLHRHSRQRGAVYHRRSGEKRQNGNCTQGQDPHDFTVL